MILQRDKDRANELEQKLGTLAADFQAMNDGSLEHKMIYSRACGKLAEQILSIHREAELDKAYAIVWDHWDSDDKDALATILGELQALGGRAGETAPK